MIACTIAIAGWWYYGNLQLFGVLMGSDEMVALHDAGGLISNLRARFTFAEWLRGHLAFITTLGWASSWSWARPPYLYLAPMVIFICFISVTYLFKIRDFSFDSSCTLPVWCLLPIFVGFSAHVLVRIALSSEGRGTSGYYLNLMAVPLGVIPGFAFYHICNHKIFAAAFYFLSIYSIGLSLFTVWSQVLLFAGISYISGSSKFYQYEFPLPPLWALPEAITRLKIISFPVLGSISFVVGSMFALMGMLLTGLKCHRANQLF